MDYAIVIQTVYHQSDYVIINFKIIGLREGPDSVRLRCMI